MSLSARNVWRHGRRSAGTFAIMLVSVLALDVLFGYVAANLQLTQDAFMRWGARGHLVIERPVSPLAERFEGVGQHLIEPPAQRAIESILADEGAVAAYSRSLGVTGMITSAGVTGIFEGVGYDADAVRRIKGPAYEYDVVAGQPLWMTANADAVVLGQGLAGMLGCNVPQEGFAPLRVGESPAERRFSCPPGPVQLSTVTEHTGYVNATQLKTTGVMDWGIKEVNDRLVVLPLATAQRLLDTGDVSEYRVLLHPGADMPAAQRRIVEAFRGSGIDASVFRWSDRATFYHEVRGVLLSFFGFVLAVASIVSFTSLLNASYMNVMRRKRELATLRSVGYSRGFVSAMTALENVWLAAAAAVGGTLGALAVTYGVRQAGWMWTPPGSSNAVPVTIAWVPTTYAVVFAGLVLLAILASWIPTRRILAAPIRSALTDI
ncbi:ABC transporter permease [Cupriavidus agavae]|nr:FtsX-like permease family protein [Cupriavidus agavae]